MPEFLVYHLKGEALEAVLGPVLEKTLERGWRALVCARRGEMLARLDLSLWTFREASFLPHGRIEAGDPASQPILLATDPVGPNAPDVLFLVDRAPVPEAFSGERIVLILDGEDPEALDAARSAWREVEARGWPRSYWQREAGRWVKKA